MYRKKLMRVCLTGVMVVSIATANVAPVFAAEPVEKVETESDSWDSISGEINFRDTDNNESIFVLVSFTHLTLPTIYAGWFLGGPGCLTNN